MYNSLCEKFHYQIGGEDAISDTQLLLCFLHLSSRSAINNSFLPSSTFEVLKWPAKHDIIH